MDILHTPDDWPRKTPAEVVVELGDDIDALPEVVVDHAIVLADVVGSPAKPTSISRAPSSVAVACLYVADFIIRGKRRLIQPELSEEAGIHERTLRNVYPDVPQSFVDGAGEEDIERLDPRFWEALRAFTDLGDSMSFSEEDAFDVRRASGVSGMTRDILDIHDEKLGI